MHGEVGEFATLRESGSENSLILRLRLRQPDALAELYDHYSKLAYAVVFRIVRQAATAEDIVQETFLRAWNSAANLHEDCTSAGPWLIAIARHCALNYVKSSEARLSAGAVHHEMDFPSVAFEQEYFGNLDYAELIAQAMTDLSEQQRRALELAYYEGLSQVAIAERLHQPLGTVKSWTRQGLQKMRKSIDRSKLHF